MKNNSKALIGASALVAIIGLVGAYTFSNAYQGDYTKKGPNYSEERHKIMEEAFEKNDYKKWKEQMNGRGRVSEIINENNFSKFAKAHKLAEEGKYDEADKIRKELGLRMRNEVGKANNFGHRKMMYERGQNRGGNFIDNNNDGICDNLSNAN